MKLLYCKNCDDVIKLDYKLRVCKCGKSSGQYLKNGLNATYSGPCIPIGFNNQSFIEAPLNQPISGMGRRFEAFIISELCPTMKKM